MKTKIVYILVSDDSDTYLEQALVSVFSLRRFNPDAFVELIVDKDTETTIVGKRIKIKELVSKITVVDVPSKFPKKQRSRYLKTTLRQNVCGTYLSIDCDTVVVGDLSVVDSIQYDLAMAYDANSPFPIGNSCSFGDNFINKNAQIVGWESLAGQYHYNSGVVFARDTVVTRKLYETWHKCWLECLACDVFVDEPALSKADKTVGSVICRMDDLLNWQIQRHGCHIPIGTKLLHYFASDRNYSAFILAQDAVHRQIKKNGDITDLVRKNLDNIETAFARTTFVISENEKNILKEIEKFPLWQIRHSHPVIINVLNKLVRFLNKIKI